MTLTELENQLDMIADQMDVVKRILNTPQVNDQEAHDDQALVRNDA